MVPNFNPFRELGETEEMKAIPLPGNSRNLLHKSSENLLPEDDNPYGITMKPPTFWQTQPQTPVINNHPEIREVRENKDSDIISDKHKLEKVVYVQIEKTIDDDKLKESNVTYVASEKEFNPDVSMEDTGERFQNKDTFQAEIPPSDTSGKHDDQERLIENAVDSRKKVQKTEDRIQDL